ncbi:hypothetical protein [Rhizobium sp. FKL33]|uniref:hypothetical protein n=1 Tax=Rhizobium sp. FKL33 TaxID=2562307 RepID=UPI0010C033E4|nr:hypothetical protein [Rhizobium sp. FKL33]
MLTGRVDELKNNKIYGWAYNSEKPGEHLVIRIMQGPQVIASGVANLMRPDLPEAGIGEGDHAFEVLVPQNITSFHGLMIIAQSVREGEIALPIATNDDRRLDDLFEVFSERYEAALFALKEEIDRIHEMQRATAETPTAGIRDDAIEMRIAKLEKRIEASEVFVMRIDSQMRALLEASKKQKQSKRFFGLF